MAQVLRTEAGSCRCRRLCPRVRLRDCPQLNMRIYFRHDTAKHDAGRPRAACCVVTVCVHMYMIVQVYIYIYTYIDNPPKQLDRPFFTGVQRRAGIRCSNLSCLASWWPFFVRWKLQANSGSASPQPEPQTFLATAASCCRELLQKATASITVDGKICYTAIFPGALLLKGHARFVSSTVVLTASTSMPGSLP